MAETLFNDQKVIGGSTAEVYQLIYHSHASADFGQDDLLKMLIDARASNERRNVTGMLLYHDEQFLQVLEGEQRVLQQLSEHIFDDPRHHAAALLSFKQVQFRDFHSWSMGFANIDDNMKRNLRGLRNYSDHEFKWEAHVIDPTMARQLLLTIKNSVQSL
jgi:hypothetical protein